MNQQRSIQAINQLSQAQFVQLLGGIFEHSPWVAERAFARHPFARVQDLHKAMADAVLEAPLAMQLALIRAHPELAGKAAVRGELTAESTREQSAAGLSECSAEEFATLQQLNADYNAKFGFPFVIAVRGHDRHSIIAHFSRRLASTQAVEIQECLEQIIKIGGFRLADAVRD
ncbi:2-oxo-4-hydroxy-4-carboxy-5-ureidoimidazoline decarboxylase [Undibacterium sp. Jales W-56]|uniref:2-oxo-4-hydroxy-4-carboxy-5-ureidoimidazoline decarboxylase n=1 Tax=Undibacterium sp. Jales W-56 TaxID=2897325 RepID=UPI0021CE31FB|nr:2-oxo-4-hydroxy-4-carboxy-5-ureidoimidazoline decarboxylase [Undibacterium sp. Jales W-56]MCU6434869.1 2-oxo-4-hydroxy-4-carboxy-5-ureidoimidazoline decarboxylase [Undibacterium sp. Jales W-56]